jgi:hypothetical protein
MFSTGGSWATEALGSSGSWTDESGDDERVASNSPFAILGLSILNVFGLCVAPG